MTSDQTQIQYRAMVAKMLEMTPDEVPAGILRRILRVHDLFVRHTAHIDLDVKTLLVAMIVEQSGIIAWED